MKLFYFESKEKLFNHIVEHNDTIGKTLLLPTGTTPIGLYQTMIKRKIDFSNTITFNLDEYYPSKSYNEASYHYYLWNNLFHHINIRLENIHLLNGNAADADIECRRYNTLIQNNPIDIAFMGIGINGHIAFNEPGCKITDTTRLIELKEITKRTNNVNYDKALTVGMAEILASKKLVLMAIGETKNDIIYDFIHHTYKMPATYLLNHRNVDLYVDKPAFSKVLNQLSPAFMQYNKILVFSPHPDDDVIGMGATIKKFIDAGKEVVVVYQTSGSNGGNKIIRQKESIHALGLLGLDDTDNIIFGNTPFYNIKKQTTDFALDDPANLFAADSDILYTLNIIQTINPDLIFFAGDICDPHKTHLTCHMIIQECLQHLEWSIPAYNYYSAWYAPTEYSVKEFFSKELMQLKIASIRAHASQLNPIFAGNLELDFYQIVAERNRKDACAITCADNDADTNTDTNADNDADTNADNDIYVEGFTSVSSSNINAIAA